MTKLFVLLALLICSSLLIPLPKPRPDRVSAGISWGSVSVTTTSPPDEQEVVNKMGMEIEPAKPIECTMNKEKAKCFPEQKWHHLCCYADPSVEF